MDHQAGHRKLQANQRVLGAMGLELGTRAMRSAGPGFAMRVFFPSFPLTRGGQELRAREPYRDFFALAGESLNRHVGDIARELSVFISFREETNQPNPQAPEKEDVERLNVRIDSPSWDVLSVAAIREEIAVALEAALAGRFGGELGGQLRSRVREWLQRSSLGQHDARFDLLLPTDLGEKWSRGREGSLSDAGWERLQRAIDESPLWKGRLVIEDCVVRDRELGGTFLALTGGRYRVGLDECEILGLKSDLLAPFDAEWLEGVDEAQNGLMFNLAKSNAKASWVEAFLISRDTYGSDGCPTGPGEDPDLAPVAWRDIDRFLSKRAWNLPGPLEFELLTRTRSRFRFPWGDDATRLVRRLADTGEFPSASDSGFPRCELLSYRQWLSPASSSNYPLRVRGGLRWSHEWEDASELVNYCPCSEDRYSLDSVAEPTAFIRPMIRLRSRS